jgi:hypothetical protein
MKYLCYTLSFLLLAKFLSAQSCQPATAYEFLDINNVKARINNGGDMWWDLDNDAAYVVPKSGNTSALFAGAVWIGGIDAQGQLRIAAQTYRQTGNDFFPGPLDATGTVTSQACSDFDRIWKVNKSTIDSFITGMFSIVPNSIVQWPAKGNPNLSFLPSQDLAPFIDADHNGVYDPVQGDYPSIAGDQALWFVFNDNGNAHSETGSPAIGLEVQCMAYAFKDPISCLFNTTFYHYKMINKGGVSLDSTFIGIWTDPALGCPYDDYIGCDSTKNLGIVYNATATDQGGMFCLENYGNDPPILAINILKGPQDENGNVHYMDHFMYYTNDFTALGSPQNMNDYYELMNSVFSDGSHLTYGVSGYGGAVNTNYAYSGSPSDFNGWSQCGAFGGRGDLRIILSSGPFYFKAGESKTFDFSVVWEDDVLYPCPSFSTINYATDCVANYFNTNIDFIDAVTNPATNNTVAVFPNPSLEDQAVTFHIKNAQRILVYDISGRLISNIPVKGQSTMQIKNPLPGGVYIYHVVFKDESVKTGKIIVQ